MPGRSAYDINLIAELDFMVTQRRIHSVYHRNIEVLRPDEMMNWDLSPWAHAESLTPLRDELWQEIFNTGFEFLADDALIFPEGEHSSELDSIMITDPSPKSNEEPESAVDVELLFHSVPACGFCRGQHIRCDRTFPSCGACAKSNRECIYYDAVLQRDVPRRSVFRSELKNLNSCIQRGLIFINLTVTSTIYMRDSRQQPEVKLLGISHSATLERSL